MEKKLECVKKRDGRTVPFDRRKIADAIFKAAQSVGGHDRYLADDLAEVVGMYLVREYKGDTPSVEDIQDVVERILIKTGHARTAKAYILYRQKRARARMIRDGYRPEDLSEREQERVKSSVEINLPVRRSDDNVSLFDKNRIVSALVRETGIPGNIAELIVIEVEEEIIASKVSRLSSSLIRELVNAKLIQYGFEAERRRHTRLGLPFYDVKTLFEGFSGMPDELSVQFGRAIKREFALNAVFPDGIVEKHMRGEITLCNIEGIDKCLYMRVPVAMKSAGRLDEEVKRCCGLFEPFVEESIVFLLPEGEGRLLSGAGKIACGSKVSAEVFFSGVTEEFMKTAVRGNMPVSFRIESAGEMERFFVMTEKEGSPGSISVGSGETGGNVLALNRILLHPALMEVYAEQTGKSLNDYAEGFISLFAETMKRQDAFFSGTSACRELLKTTGQAKRTIEAVIPDGEPLFSGEGFLRAMLDASLTVEVRLPPLPEARKRLLAALRLFEPEVFRKRRVAARMDNV